MADERAASAASERLRVQPSDPWVSPRGTAHGLPQRAGGEQVYRHSLVLHPIITGLARGEEDDRDDASDMPDLVDVDE